MDRLVIRVNRAKSGDLCRILPTKTHEIDKTFQAFSEVRRFHVTIAMFKHQQHPLDN